MKKFFTLLMLLSLGSTLAHATDYGLTIAGKAITSTGDIDAGQSSGTINWDGKRLTLTDVKVNYTSTSSGSFIFYSGTEDLSISFIGDNTISSSRHIIYSTSSAAIGIWGERNKTGRLTLSINDDAGNGFCPVWVDGNLRIGCLYLHALLPKLHPVGRLQLPISQFPAFQTTEESLFRNTHLFVQGGHIFGTEASRAYRILYRRRYQVCRLGLGLGAHRPTGKCKRNKNLFHI